MIILFRPFKDELPERVKSLFSRALDFRKLSLHSRKASELLPHIDFHTTFSTSSRLFCSGNPVLILTNIMKDRLSRTKC